MKSSHLLFLIGCLTAAAFLLVGPSVHGFIDKFRPQTLGAACDRAQSITVMKVKEFDEEKGIILFEKVKDLKGTYARPGLRETLGSAHLAEEKKRYLDWIGAGKTAVVFRYENRQAVCIGKQWTVCDAGPPKDETEP
jgi:hypothetical protein